MIRPPPRSTLFPYTTLSDLTTACLRIKSKWTAGPLFRSGSAGMPRSEERFSRNAETDLVCRLLLEKKKTEYRQPTETKLPFFRGSIQPAAAPAAHRHV